MLRTEQESLVNPSHLEILIKSNGLLTQQLEAQRKRIQFLESRNEYLEFILEQRIELTTTKYCAVAHNEMYNKVYDVFRKRPGVGLTYEDAEKAFKEDYGFFSANVGQRMRDLFRDKLLWKREDKALGKKHGVMRYYLKLETLGAEK